MATTLNEIGLKYGTDKSTVTHHYLDNYQSYLDEWRLREFVMWELGVGNGGSLKMWAEFFPNAKVFGIDNNKDLAGENIFIGDQTDEKFLSDVMQRTGSPDLIVDDASHEGKLTIATFKWLFPRINAGGLYFVEDCSTFYSTHYSGEFESNGRSRVFNFFTDLAYHVDVAGRGMCGNPAYALTVQNPNFDPVPEYSPILESMHIHCGLWLFKRRK